MGSHRVGHDWSHLAAAVYFIKRDTMSILLLVMLHCNLYPMVKIHFFSFVFKK